MNDATAWERYKQFAAWLLLVGVPFLLATIKTGMSYFPRTKAIGDKLSRVIDLFSLVTFKDSPKSLKAPLLQKSEPPILSSAIPRPDNPPPILHP